MKLAIAAVLFFVLWAGPANAADFYVSSVTGDNENAGTKEAPFLNIERAIKAARVGDTVHVARGNYYGLRERGLIEVLTPVTLLGGYNDDFSKRNMKKFPTLIQPPNEAAASAKKALMILKKSKAGEHFVLDGFIFDMGLRNSYESTEARPDGLETGSLLLPPKFNNTTDKFPTVAAQCLFIENAASAGDVTVQNNVFANCAQFAIQGGHKQGTFRVLNNVFVSNRMAAIEVFGTGGKKGPKGPIETGGEVEIAYNTILFSWSRLADYKDMGYGIRIMTLLSYHVHHNIIAGSTLTAIDHTRFNKGEWIQVEDNVLFANREGDLLFAESGKVEMERVELKHFGDLGLASALRNRGDTLDIPVSSFYIAGFLATGFTPELNADAPARANAVLKALHLPELSAGTSRVSMFANRYPYIEALRLFGAAKGVGAQQPTK